MAAHRSAALVMGAALVVAACGSSKPCAHSSPPAAAGPQVVVPAATAATSAEPSLPSVPIALAQPHKSRASVPARFEVALPARGEDLQADPGRYPTEAYVSGRLCAGDDGMQRRLIAAFERSAALGSEPIQYDTDGCAAHCRWAVRTAASGALAPAVQSALISSLRDCVEPAGELATLMGSDAAPAEAVEHWLMWSEPRVGYLASMPRVLDRGKTLPNQRFGLRFAAVAVGQVVDPQVTELLLARHQAEKDPRLKEVLAIGLYKQSDPRARKLFLDTCASLSEPDGLCGSRFVNPTRDVDRAVRDGVLEAWKLTEQYPRDQLVEALARCADGSEHAGESAGATTRALCLRELARFDWARARAIHPSLPEGAREVAKEVGSLVGEFPSREIWMSEVLRTGLLTSAPPSSGRLAVTMQELFEDAQRGYLFDTETGAYPNMHDLLLFRLASLTGSDLAGVLFEELPPPLDDDATPYQLIAYADGHRYQLQADNYGDWYDVEATLGLLNALLRERGKTTRFVSLRSYGQECIVIVADEGAIARGVQARLLDIPGANAPMEAGKAFEDRVLDQLQDGGPAGP